MHSFNAPSGVTYHHNGDFSGSVILTEEEIMQFGLDGGGSGVGNGVYIPFEDIRALYLEYLRRSKISALEQASYDFLEGEARRGL
jgi:hypothetical protein